MGNNGTANAQRVAHSVEGVVEATNERGIRVNGAWVNVSKFKPVELPPIGAQVRVTVDAKGFIVALEVLDRANARSPQDGVDQSPASNRAHARLTVLEAAAHFAAARTDIKSSDVLRIADAWLQWVERE